MISKLSDQANIKLYRMFDIVLKIDPVYMTKMSDLDALAMFLKLSFQNKHGIGVFSHYGSYSQERGDIDYVENELANLELLT